MTVALAVQEKQLIGVGEARRLLAGCERIDKANEIRAQASAIQSYLGKRTDQAMNAAEIKVRAERRLGELLRDSEVGRGRPRKNSHGASLLPRGISYTQSSRWQDVARVLDGPFEAYIAERRQAGAEITTAGVLRLLPVENGATEATTGSRDPGESCETEEGACGPVTPRDRMLHIALLMKGFNKIRDYDPAQLAQLGTKKSLKELSVQIGGVIQWLESFQMTIKGRL